ncbi:ABC transporter ATP-binding protein [Prosthecodimorpha staleyi]|uniref:ABC transporter ATP-binding protein/permease n=1 Tax=Prosthecodimorpha staleyi TaxID=2840188 RepID=A0A947GAS3_9HYPH|nr:ABC transporter ATP-binding protein [Prosthecodimorpha staleyi]MBT9289443.1 ABC transporter ATP-binding protein/permease [Prosthecodimorpha staleyi]
MTGILFDDRSADRREQDADGGFAVPDMSTVAVMRRILRDHVVPRLKLVLLTVLAMTFAAAGTGALPFLMQFAADEIFIAKNETFLLGLPPVIIVVMVARSWAEYFARVSQGYLSNRIVADLRSQLFEKLAFADVGWLQSTHSGRFVSVFMNDVTTINTAASQTITAVVQNFMQVVFLCGAMIWMDWRLALITLAALPLGGWFVRRQKTRARQSVSSALQEVGALGTIVSETLKSIRVVKAYHRESHETNRARHIIERTLRHMMETVRTRAASGPITEALGGVGIAAAIFYGGWQGISGNVTLGHFMGFMTAALLVYQPVKALASLHNQLIEGTVAAARVFAILDQDQRVTEVPDARPLVLAGGALRFEGVTFGYEPDQPVLKNFDLDIPAGTRVALIGASGAGKSTVINLILRFFDPQQGRVLIDGQDVRTATIASVRLASALLTQEPVLFDDTIKANIRYGSEDASDEAVIAAAQAAAAHDFIMGLPNGYESRVGEAGQLLSGGQKQRIAFARAMLRSAPILLLDEPTSALDGEAEARIQEALETLLEDRTVIVIAHRLSTIRKADLICVMDGGVIAELGSHDELVASGGLYARMMAGQGHSAQGAAVMLVDDAAVARAAIESAADRTRAAQA